MFDLTPGERRGALVVLALFALGTVWDLAHLTPAAAPPARWTAPVADGAGEAPGTAGPAMAGPPPAAPTPREPLDLNTADAAALDALPGIGPVLAGRIVEQRRMHGAFRTVDELLAVPGIGPRLLERLRPLVTARTPDRARSPVQNATRIHQ